MNRIKELRKQMGITQKELANHLQIADSTLSYWEMGKYEPDNDALMKLSRFFKVPIDYILSGDFIKWNIDGDSATYHNADGMRLSDSDMSVSEPNMTYFLNTDFGDMQSAFNRAEFKSMTQEEIEMLAEYAVFIKSRRKTE